MSAYTPTASGRSTPLHFKDVVSALKECGHIFECACLAMQTYAGQLLTGVSQQIVDTLKQYKNETESEAHQARHPEYSRLTRI